MPGPLRLPSHWSQARGPRAVCLCDGNAAAWGLRGWGLGRCDPPVISPTQASWTGSPRRCSGWAAWSCSTRCRGASSRGCTSSATSTKVSGRVGVGEGLTCPGRLAGPSLPRFTGMPRALAVSERLPKSKCYFPGAPQPCRAPAGASWRWLGAFCRRGHLDGTWKRRR